MHHQTILRVLRTTELHKCIVDFRIQFKLPKRGFSRGEAIPDSIFWSAELFCHRDLPHRFGLSNEWGNLFMQWLLYGDLSGVAHMKGAHVDQRICGLLLTRNYENDTITIPLGQDFSDDALEFLAHLLRTKSQQKYLQRYSRETDALFANILIAQAFAMGLSKPKEIILQIEDCYRAYHDYRPRIPVSKKPTYNYDALSKRIKRFKEDYPPMKSDTSSPFWMSINV